MADFTKTNFADAPDRMAARGAQGMEGRMVRDALGSTELGVGRFRWEPGVRSPFGHRHRTQEEVYVVVEGSGRVKLDDEIVELAQWDVVRVAPTVGRAFEGGPEGLTLVVAGGTRPPEGDGELVPDFWP